MHPDLRDTLRMLRNENTSVRLTAVYMEDVIWRRRGQARLPLHEVSAATGLSKDTSHRAIKRLVGIDFIERTRVGGRDNGSVYRLGKYV